MNREEKIQKLVDRINDEAEKPKQETNPILIAYLVNQFLEAVHEK